MDDEDGLIQAVESSPVESPPPETIKVVMDALPEMLPLRDR